MSHTNRIHHVNIMVDDLAAADEFYSDVLGLERNPTPDLGFPAQFFAINAEQEIHVNELADVRPERAHFCVRVADFNETFRRALELGIIETDTWGRVRRLPGGAMQLFVRDPAGNLIEISCEEDQEVDPAIFELDVVEPDETFSSPPK